MDTLKETVKRLSETGDRLLVGGVPEGFDALLLVTLATEGGDVLMVSRDDVSMARKAEALSFFAPGLEIAMFPIGMSMLLGVTSTHKSKFYINMSFHWE